VPSKCTTDFPGVLYEIEVIWKQVPCILKIPEIQNMRVKIDILSWECVELHARNGYGLDFLLCTMDVYMD